MKVMFGMKQALMSGGIFVGLLFALVSIDARVQERFHDLVAGQGVSSFADRASQLGDALAVRVPDVILLTALLSPRDEEDLIAHLRTLEGLEHVQTHTLPMLAGRAPEDEQGGGGLFGRLRRKKEPEVIAGCDPAIFAEEVRNYLARSVEMIVSRARETRLELSISLRTLW